MEWNPSNTPLRSFLLFSEFTCRMDTRINSLIKVTEFFYVAGAISFILFYVFPADEQAIANYLHDVRQSLQLPDLEVTEKGSKPLNNKEGSNSGIPLSKSLMSLFTSDIISPPPQISAQIQTQTQTQTQTQMSLPPSNSSSLLSSQTFSLPSLVNKSHGYQTVEVGFEERLVTVESYNSMMSTLSTYESISPDPASLSSTVTTTTTTTTASILSPSKDMSKQDENGSNTNNPGISRVSSLSSSATNTTTVGMPIQRVMSIGSIRAASEGVGSVLRRVRSVFTNSLDASSLRKSMSEMVGVGIGEPGDDENGEEAPLLVKV